MIAVSESLHSPVSARRHSFAYLFERFPSFVQTFVYREAIEMVRQEMAPWLVSIRRPDDPDELTEPVEAEVFHLPEADAIRAEIDGQIAQQKLPQRIRRAVAERRKRPDSNRVFEAVWLEPRLRDRGIRHVHAHFGGLAARTAWMLRKLYGFSYSFTGHANDIFCENDFPITNAMLVRGAKLVVTETDFARRWMEERYPFARGRIVRVFNGIATQDFPPRQPAAGSSRIISVGRYVEKKGFADLIEACRFLRARGRRFECAIVGGGPLETVLRTRIERASLGEVVRLLGAQPQHEVRDLLAASGIFVLASVPETTGGSDNLPTVILEAMLTGLPVVSTKVAGIPELVRDGETGLLVGAKEPAALAMALEKLLADPALAKRMGARGQQVATEKFAIEKTVGALKRLLVQRCDVQAPEAACALEPSLRRPWWRGLFRLMRAAQLQIQNWP
ncbi:MAG TPA: glycosyltransferase family 4 protein [Chthoniobacteraceae bacterium]|nr:glycosyltransferase family 4 protein [Chthoniobacteraceae bacterium]